MSTEQLENLEQLARRAKACPRWRWMPGMLVMSDPTAVPRVIGSPIWPSDLRARVTSAVLGRWFGVGQFCVDHPDAEHETMSGDDLPRTLPDLTDPATLGCLLAIVREAWGGDVLIVCPQHFAGKWVIDLPNGEVLSERTEAEALVAALEAAP